MEVHFTEELERKINDLAAQSGCSADQLVQEVVAEIFDE